MTASLEGAIIQRDGKTYAVITRTPAGTVSPDHLERVSAVARKYTVPALKITGGRRIALVGIAPEDLDGVFRDLGDAADRTGGPCRDLPCRSGGNLPGIHRCRGLVSSFVCVHAENYATGNEGGHGSSH